MDPKQTAAQKLLTLCDVSLNLNRQNSDFLALLRCIEQHSKDCSPYKGKILTHLALHARLNPKINLAIIAACYAQASCLSRTTQNKNEGPLGSWKESFSKEIQNFEDNLDHLYQLVGLESNRVVSREISLNGRDVSNHEVVTSSDNRSDKTTTHIEEYLTNIRISAYFICALISVQTDFDIPLPVNVLLRLASKVCLLRCREYKKNSTSALKDSVFSMTPKLIEIGLMLFKSSIAVLGTNIIPFMSFLNQTLLRTLEWTRSSDLVNYDESSYHSIRGRTLSTLDSAIEQLSLNINLEPQLLRILIELELVQNLKDLESSSDQWSQIKEQHALTSLKCLERLFLAYSKLLDETLEKCIKGFVINSCIRVYRDFEATTTNTKYRYQLLSILQVIANQPYATSTTEISHNILELAVRLESDSNIRSLAKRSLSVGLAHRPTIVSYHDVHNIYNTAVVSMTNDIDEQGDSCTPIESEEQFLAVSISGGTVNELENKQSSPDEQPSAVPEPGDTIPVLDPSQSETLSDPSPVPVPALIQLDAPPPATAPVQPSPPAPVVPGSAPKPALTLTLAPPTVELESEEQVEEKKLTLSPTIIQYLK